VTPAIALDPWISGTLVTAAKEVALISRNVAVNLNIPSP
jgi:hypothetical protein